MAHVTVMPSRAEVRAEWGVQEMLLVCGILAGFIYITSDFVAATSWRSYSYAHQTISELMAIGAPTRPLLIVLFLPWNVLVAAFGVGVWRAAGRKTSLRVTGVLLFIYSFVSLAGLFSPMHLRGAAGSTTDVMHIAITMGIVFLTLLSIGFGSSADGRWFRAYSMATIALLILFGAIAGEQGKNIAANLPTPWVGIEERVNVYLSMLWMLMLAVVLLRRKKLAEL